MIQFIRKRSDIVLISCVLIAAVLLWYLSEVLLLLFAGVLFAVFLSRVSKWIQKYAPVSYLAALLFAILTFLIVSILIGVIAAPLVAEQSREFLRELPEATAQVQQFVDVNLRQWIPESFTLSNIQQDQSWIENLPRYIGTGLDAVGAVTGALTGLAVIIVFGFFAALDPEPYKRGFLALIPKSEEKDYEQVLDRLSDSLWQWLLGRFLSMLVIGLMTWIGLYVLGVPLSLLLGLIAGLLSFIPNIGPILSVVPPALLAFPNGIHLVLYVIALYIVVQILESNVITPYIQQRMIHVPAGLVIAAQVVFAYLFGFLGLMFATPLLVAIIVITRQLYVHRTLGKKL